MEKEHRLCEEGWIFKERMLTHEKKINMQCKTCHKSIWK